MEKFKLTQLVFPPISGEWGKEDNTGDGIFVIRTTNFDKTGRIDYSDLTTRIIDKKKIEKIKLFKGDIIIEKSGGGPNTPVGRVVIFDKEDNETYICNNFTTILRPRNNFVLPKYLLHQFYYLYQTGKVKKYQNQTVGLFNLKLNRYLEEEVSLPPLDEQSKTVAQLNKIQELIDKRIETINLLDKYIRSVFLEMFGEPISDSLKIGKKPLSFFGDWKSGGTPPTNERVHYEGNIPWYTSGELNNIFIDNSHDKITVQAIKKTSAKLVAKNSLLVGMYDTAALKCSITLVESSCNQAIAFAKLKKDICDPVFIYFNLILSRDFYLNQRKGARQKNFNLSKIKSLQVLYPEKSRQDIFVKKFFQVYSLKQQYQQSLQFLEELFQTTLHNAFSEGNQIDEEKLFEDILKDLTIADVKKGNRLQYLINWLNKEKETENFSSIDNYTVAIERVLELLEDGSIEQIIVANHVKLKVAL